MSFFYSWSAQACIAQAPGQCGGAQNRLWQCVILGASIALQPPMEITMKPVLQATLAVATMAFAAQAAAQITFAVPAQKLEVTTGSPEKLGPQVQSPASRPSPKAG